MRFVMGLLLLVVIGLLPLGVAAQDVTRPAIAPEQGAVADQESVPPPLPRWREGGTPYDAHQSLQPYPIHFTGQRDIPTSGLIASPPEYSPVRGILVYYISGQWTTVVRDLVVALTQPAEHDEIAYVMCTSTAQQTAAYNAFVAGGADMS